MKSLYTISTELVELTNTLEATHGELTPEIEKLLEVNEISLTTKLDSYDRLLDELKMREEFLKEKELAFKAAKQAMGKCQDRLKTNIKACMTLLGLKRVNGNDCSFLLSNAAPKLSVVDDSKIPNKYWITETTFKLDNAALLADLKDGAKLEGVGLEDVVSLRRSINKETK